MTPVRCDALVLFGISGDLAFRKILPAVLQPCLRQQLDLPVIGVARGEFDLPRLIARLHANHCNRRTLKVDPAACARRCAEARLAFVQGDYHDSAAYVRLQEALAGCQHPLYYLAIPPSLFPVVIGGLDHAGAAREGAHGCVNRSEGIWPAAGRSTGSCTRSFRERDVFRIDHYLGKEAVQNLLYFRFAASFLEPVWSRHYIDNIRVRWPKNPVSACGLFYEEAGAIRDVIQNHLLQVLACLTMEAPTGDDIEAVRDRKAKLLRAVRPLEVEMSYADSTVVTDRRPGWHPQIRARKPVPLSGWKSTTGAGLACRFTCDRVKTCPCRLRSDGGVSPSPTGHVWRHHLGYSEYLRFRLSPDVAIAMGARVKAPGEGMRGETVELFAMHQHPEEAGPYERLLLDAVHGDPGLFAQEDFKVRRPGALLIRCWPSPCRYTTMSRWLGSEEAGYFVNRPGGWHPLRMDSVNRAIF